MRRKAAASRLWLLVARASPLYTAKGKGWDGDERVIRGSSLLSTTLPHQLFRRLAGPPGPAPAFH
jgi:hypothetical protein